ncbi:MAG TPA: hypothetical protein DIC34_03380 [Treponema sp.]|nr:MAG: hypothetical protein A2001_08420 [Treponema sp. GWC1_61_84]OHE66314.1 MAG: hypothetical protein A2Y36_08995 [Treponema sp. GWA1_62_8]OHE72099.1 MAG: hypothetical protein A2413_16690 [Treponema sp. RIFOXYC1_FULL_61_9]HCM25582.1 hypothetical protein [Treponema sp.]
MACLDNDDTDRKTNGYICGPVKIAVPVSGLVKPEKLRHALGVHALPRPLGGKPVFLVLAVTMELNGANGFDAWKASRFHMCQNTAIVPSWTNLN